MSQLERNAIARWIYILSNQMEGRILGQSQTLERLRDRLERLKLENLGGSQSSLMLDSNTEDHPRGLMIRYVGVTQGLTNTFRTPRCIQRKKKQQQTVVIVGVLRDDTG